MPLQNSDLWEPHGELTGFQTSAQGTQADSLALTQFCCLFGGRREIWQARICLSEAPQKNGPAVGCHHLGVRLRGGREGRLMDRAGTRSGHGAGGQHLSVRPCACLGHIPVPLAAASPSS